MDEKLRAILSEVLDIDPLSITDNSSPETIESWDSVNNLNLVVALEENLGIRIEPEDIFAMSKSFKALKDVVAKYL